MRQTINPNRPFRDLSDMQVADMLEKLEAEMRRRIAPPASRTVYFAGINHDTYYRELVPAMHAAYEAHRAWEKANA
jgi:hypothetical protein